MSRFRTLMLASAVLVIGACSDTRSPTAPAETDPAQSEQSAEKELRGVWGEAEAAAALKQGGVDPVHSPLLCNRGGSGPECLRVFHNGTFVQRVFHRGVAQGNGCSRSIIKIAGRVRGRSGFVCHRRGDVLFFTWFIEEFWRFGTRIQVDFTGAGGASPTSFVFTNYR